LLHDRISKGKRTKGEQFSNFIIGLFIGDNKFIIQYYDNPILWYYGILIGTMGAMGTMGFTHRCVLVALTGLIYASPVRAVITKHRVQPYDILISLLFNFLMMMNFILQHYDFYHNALLRNWDGGDGLRWIIIRWASPIAMFLSPLQGLYMLAL